MSSLLALVQRGGGHSTDSSPLPCTREWLAPRRSKLEGNQISPRVGLRLSSKILHPRATPHRLVPSPGAPRGQERTYGSTLLKKRRRSIMTSVPRSRRVVHMALPPSPPVPPAPRVPPAGTAQPGAVTRAWLACHPGWWAPLPSSHLKALRAGFRKN